MFCEGFMKVIVKNGSFFICYMLDMLDSFASRFKNVANVQYLVFLIDVRFKLFLHNVFDVNGFSAL